MLQHEKDAFFAGGILVFGILVGAFTGNMTLSIPFAFVAVGVSAGIHR